MAELNTQDAPFPPGDYPALVIGSGPGALQVSASLRALARIPVAVAGLWLTYVIYTAGHWFTLTRDGETARVAGDWAMLDAETLRTLGDGARDLAGVADTLSVVMVWALAISAISLVCSIILNLWRLARG